MMDIGDSPFTPDQPVSPDLFTGREDLVERLRRVARRAANHKQIQMVYVRGMRGIGKSSLVRNVQRGLEEDFIGATVNLGGVGSIEGALEATWREIAKRNSHGAKWGGKIRNIFEGLSLGIQVTAVGGVNVTFPPKDENGLIRKDNFAVNLGGFVRNVKGCKGMFLVWDDINGLAEAPQFAHWLKSFLESPSAEANTPILLVLTGLEERRQSIIRNNPSAARIFYEVMDVGPWSDDETAGFLRKGFDQARLQLHRKKDLLPMYSTFCKGVPVLAQEFGDATCKWSDRWKTPEDAFAAGLYNAAESIGRKWLNESIIGALRSKEYVRLLPVLAEITSLPEFRFRRTDLMGNLPEGISDTTADNFLTRMKKLGALEMPKNTRGEYQFPDIFHYFYLCRSHQEKGKRK